MNISHLSVRVAVASAQAEQVPVEGEVDPGVGEAVEGHQPVQRLHVHHLSRHKTSQKGGQLELIRTIRLAENR